MMRNKRMADATDTDSIGKNSRCAVIVAHPDDETLWAGGLMLMYPQAEWIVATICRKSDPDRSPKFFKAIEKLNATGFMADLDDSPEQTPLDETDVRKTILELLPPYSFDLIITHSPSGEYTRHLRHEETGTAVLNLWKSNKLRAEGIWMFAYEDSNRRYLPRAVDGADVLLDLSEETWKMKYDIITGIYGFDRDSFEAKTTPRKEAFWCFDAGC